MTDVCTHPAHPDVTYPHHELVETRRCYSGGTVEQVNVHITLTCLTCHAEYRYHRPYDPDLDLPALKRGTLRT
jgi:hypothetical protein